MKRLRNHGLTLFFFVLFLATLVGQALVGHAAFNQEQMMGGSPTVPLGTYLKGPDFAADVAENWQSEYLQFFLLIMLTVWLVQKGSSESKKPGDEGLESDEEQKVGRFAGPDSPRWARAAGWRLSLYSHSLGLLMGLLFLGSWFAQSVAGHAAYNAQREEAGLPSWTWLKYVSEPDFWDRSLQNWQSEFLAVTSMTVFAIFLRERGSSESKKVGSPHEAHE
ncbi:DUF6766 family protein [Aestuariimicrobium sp. T2.26MG-19.2B]|uniref:DUF6766 family protein n=1 Tax=Aestuariimicrobium sp. T2.26MG-19.2B TaxID=3040679 RepID=UPI0024774C34|nr:DUF6766 family protein [Aestuariimicrobium sp. T2.26MG-19.2B]CAI9405040.1 hypothetical protein AESSP_01332 [Aestuariimicrobium sp. T2.26MG-19.2B]